MALINLIISKLKKLNQGNPGARNPMDCCRLPDHSITPSGK